MKARDYKRLIDTVCSGLRPDRRPQYSYVDRSSGTNFVFPGGTFNHGLRDLASVTARAGYTWGPGLLYIKGGYAYADTRNNGIGAFVFNDSRDG